MKWNSILITVPHQITLCVRCLIPNSKWNYKCNTQLLFELFNRMFRNSHHLFGIEMIFFLSLSLSTNNTFMYYLIPFIDCFAIVFIINFWFRFCFKSNSFSLSFRWKLPHVGMSKTNSINELQRFIAVRNAVKSFSGAPTCAFQWKRIKDESELCDQSKM